MSPPPRIAVIYAYIDRDEQSRKNLRRFFQQGGYLPHAEYYLVVNRPTEDEPLDRGMLDILPTDAPNFHLMCRPNRGFDFGGYAHALRHIMAGEGFDYYFFLNASAAIAMAEPVARLLAAELGRDEAWVEAQVNEFTQLAQQYRVG